MLNFIINAQSLLIYSKGKTNTIGREHPNFEEISEALNTGDWDKAVELIDFVRTILEFSSDRITVDPTGSYLVHDGYPVDNSLTRRIVNMKREGKNCNAMINFLHNLMENPSESSVEQLYMFLEANDLPITPDGYFMAYKNVTEDYKDKFSHTFDNRIGKTVSMPRNQVDESRHNTCSRGLHFCSIHYIEKMWGTSGRNLRIKINPRDVVAIPSDYENSKGRCSSYIVVDEVDFTTGAFETFDESVFGEEETERVAESGINTINVGDVFEDLDRRRRGRTIKVFSAGLVNVTVRNTRNNRETILDTNRINNPLLFRKL